MDIWFLFEKILLSSEWTWNEEMKIKKNIKTFLFEWLLKDPTNKVIFRSNAVEILIHQQKVPEKVPKVYRKQWKY